MAYNDKVKISIKLLKENGYSENKNCGRCKHMLLVDWRDYNRIMGEEKIRYCTVCMCDLLPKEGGFCCSYETGHCDKWEKSE